MGIFDRILGGKPKEVHTSLVSGEGTEQSPYFSFGGLPAFLENAIEKHRHSDPSNPQDPEFYMKWHEALFRLTPLVPDGQRVFYIRGGMGGMDGEKVAAEIERYLEKVAAVPLKISHPTVQKFTHDDRT